MRLVEMLRHHGVHPVVVFDGGRLPMKGEEEGSRAQCAHRLLCCCSNTLPVLLHTNGWRSSSAHSFPVLT